MNTPSGSATVDTLTVGPGAGTPTTGFAINTSGKVNFGVVTAGTYNGVTVNSGGSSGFGTISSAAITATGSNVIGGVTMNGGNLSWAQYSNFATGNGNTNTRMFGSYMAVDPLYNSDFFITNNMQTITLPTSSNTVGYYNKIVSATKDSAGYGQSAIRLHSYGNGGSAITLYAGITPMIHVGTANVVVGNATGGSGFEGFYTGVSTGLTVFGSNNPLPSATTGVATLQVMSTEAVGTNVGASIGLGGRSTDYGGGALFQTFGRISGGSSGAGGYSGFLSFATMGPADGSITEKMRILAAGNVGIGTSAPAYPLDVTGNIRATGNLISAGSGNSILLVANGVAVPTVASAASSGMRIQWNVVSPGNGNLEIVCGKGGAGGAINFYAGVADNTAPTNLSFSITASNVEATGFIRAKTTATTSGARAIELNGIFFPSTPVARPGFQVVYYQYSSGYTSSTIFSVPIEIRAGIVLFNFVQDNGNHINIPLMFNSAGVYAVAGTFSGNLSVAASGTGGWTMTNMTSATLSRGSLMYLGSFAG